MDDKLATQLRSVNPATRKKALQTLANTGTMDDLKYLKYVFENDPDPLLREFAKLSAQQIRKRAQSQDEAVREQVNAKPAKLRGAEKAYEKRRIREQVQRYNLIGFGIISAIMAAVIIWTLYGVVVNRVVDQQSVQQRLISAPSMPSGVAPTTLEGVVYRTQVGASTINVLEPTGVQPAKGWGLLVALYSAGTDPTLTLGDFVRRVTDDRYIAVAPAFPADGELRTNVNDLYTALRALDARYTFNPRVRVAYGVGEGAFFLMNYDVVHISEFSAISIWGTTNFPEEMFSALGQQYIIMTGLSDENVEVTRDLINRFAILPGTQGRLYHQAVVQGQGRLPDASHYERTRDLIRVLEAQ